MTSNPVSNPAASSAGTSSSTSNTGNLDSMFLQLLITQLKNQDPTSPMDPSAFVQQLAQVTSLEQLTQINQLLQNTLGGLVTNSSSGGD
jgi:flagellar basal-body rod modification protein FlgD